MKHGNVPDDLSDFHHEPIELGQRNNNFPFGLLSFSEGRRGTRSALESRAGSNGATGDMWQRQEAFKNRVGVLMK